MSFVLQGVPMNILSFVTSESPFSCFNETLLEPARHGSARCSSPHPSNVRRKEKGDTGPRHRTKQTGRGCLPALAWEPCKRVCPPRASPHRQLHFKWGKTKRNADPFWFLNFLTQARSPVISQHSRRFGMAESVRPSRSVEPPAAPQGPCFPPDLRHADFLGGWGLG